MFQNDVFLILLPYPRTLRYSGSNISASLRFLLLMAAEVESNPGHEFEDLADQLKLIAGDIRKIKAGKLSAIDKKLDKIASLDIKLTDCVNKIAELECSMDVMEKQLDDLENRSHRSHLIMYSINEQERARVV